LEFYGQDPVKSEWFGRIITENNAKRLAAAVDDAKPFLVHGGEYNVKEKFVQVFFFAYFIACIIGWFS
jgi:hypothetical protein